MMETLHITTNAREELIDITGQVRRLVREQQWESGAVLLYSPHTTSAVTVNEGADPDVQRDIEVNLRKLVPQRGDYRHAEGNSDAHIKTSLVGPDQLLIVEGSDVRLGTWQRIFFCEFDGPRERKLWVKWLGNV